MIPALVDSLEDLRILVADDDEILLSLMLDILITIGFKDILTAHNGQQAIDQMHANTVDLIITDYQMPVVNGLDVIKQLRSGQTPLPHDTLAIVITADTSAETFGTALALNVNGFITKPFQSIMVLKKIIIALLEENEVQPARHYTSVCTEPMDPAPDLNATIGGIPVSPVAGEVKVNFSQLRPGMVLRQNVRTTRGALLLRKGCRLGSQTINRLKDLRNAIDCEAFLVTIDQRPFKPPRAVSG